MRLRVGLMAVVCACAGPAWTQQTAPNPAQADGTPVAEYTGPAILTRGAGSLFRIPTRSIRFQPFFTLSATYDAGLGGVIARSDGSPDIESSYGGAVGFGLSGYVRRRRDQLGLTYQGSYNHYVRAPFYDGTNQSLMLGYARQLTRQWTFSVREVAGISSRVTFAAGPVGAFGLIDPQFAEIPDNELFDNRVSYSSTIFDMTYRKSARLSFNFGGDFMTVRRRSSALFGYDIGRARGDMAYRMNARTTVGVTYEFNHYEFTKAFGASDIHGAELFINRRINKLLQFSLNAGGRRVETLGIGRVDLPPELAAIFGRNFGVQAVYRINYIPSGIAQLSWGGRNHSGLFAVRLGATPGNGIYLTSRETTYSTGYTYNGFRGWSLTSSANYSTYTSLAQDIGKFRMINVGGGFSHPLWSQIYLTGRADWYDYEITQPALDRRSWRTTLGLTYTPSDLPLSIW